MLVEMVPATEVSNGAASTGTRGIWCSLNGEASCASPVGGSDATLHHHPHPYLRFQPAVRVLVSLANRLQGETSETHRAQSAHLHSRNPQH